MYIAWIYLYIPMLEKMINNFREINKSVISAINYSDKWQATLCKNYIFIMNRIKSREAYFNKNKLVEIKTSILST